MEQKLYMEDEAFVAAWEGAGEGKYPVFPGVALGTLASLEVSLCQSFGGRIPVLHLKEREEFESLICRIFYKGEPRPIPPSMGAMTVRGWRDLFGQTHRAIVLSDGWYSAVPPEAVGLSPEEWKAKSFLLRRVHEATHYSTLRIFGFMQNALKDELIADAMGLIGAFGEYKPELFLRFMGLENHPEYRPGGRLENYKPRDREMGEEEFKELQSTACEAALELGAFLDRHPEYLQDEASRLALLKKMALQDGIWEGLAL